jgi:Tol biopolymer transport system component
MMFASTRAGNMQIWAAGSDGSNPVQVTSIDPFAGSPRWSPDGRKIVVDARPKGNSNSDLYVIDARGGPSRAIVAEEGDQLRASWSHDGKWIYFASNHTGSQQIWKARAEGGGLLQLTQRGGTHPFESPDGRFVYFANPDDFAIWRVPAEGGEAAVVQKNLYNPDSWDVTADGIYFVSEERLASAARQWVLKLFRFDTQQVTMITRLSRRPHSPTPLDVSPDGKWFLYVQNDRDESDLMLVENFR